MIKIPARLATLLSGDPALEGAVKLSLDAFEPWIANSNVPFFQEYTGHGIEHIEHVLSSAISIIRDQAWSTMTSGDAATLIIAVLLHDCAMHLTEDGFVSLMASAKPVKRAPDFSDKPWNLLWEDFLGEASRFDGRQLTALFGDDTPVRRPPLRVIQLTQRDKLLIGEFVRRHHARLAHEIAHFGVPGPEPERLRLRGFSPANDHIPVIAGLVARSHGTHIRAVIDPLAKGFDVREFRGVHAVFLMALLRVADYLQVDADRAPAEMLQVRRILSPTSQRERAAHQAIRDIRTTHEDPEAIFIDARPESARLYFRIRDWLTGIQKELDDSWAVLGEVYGRFDELKALGLVLRRVRSSIDETEVFAEKINYVPKLARFRAADADLLKLLIEPLYGDRPEIGLRELIQNSVDAVLELQEYSEDIDRSDCDDTIAGADVLLSIDTNSAGEHWLEVKDYGIGMTSEVIINYFLAAGASFRRSEDWRKLFENPDGRSKVLRAGRFGVGALAAFLLGPEIEVSTRHVGESRGIRFAAGVESDILELEKIDRGVGTTIRIKMSSILAAQLRKAPDDRWDWYCLREPSVHRLVDGIPRKQKYTLPGANAIPLPTGWRRIRHPDYRDIVWTYGSAPKLTCNGIRIASHFEESGRHWPKNWGLKLPNVAVFDADGKLPLNLQRTGLTITRFPFDVELANDVINDFLQRVLDNALLRGPSTLDFSLHASALHYVGSARSDTSEYGDEEWFFTQSAFGYLDAHLLWAAGVRSALLLRVHRNVLSKCAFNVDAQQAIITAKSDASLTTNDFWFRSLLELGQYTTPETTTGWVGGALTVLRRLGHTGVRILISEEALQRAHNGKVPKRLLRCINSESSKNDWCLLSIGQCPKANFDFSEFLDTHYPGLDAMDSAAEVYLNDKPIEASPIAARWMEAFDTPLIPLEGAERKKHTRIARNRLLAVTL